MRTALFDVHAICKLPKDVASPDVADEFGVYRAPLKMLSRCDECGSGTKKPASGMFADKM